MAIRFLNQDSDPDTDYFPPDDSAEVDLPGRWGPGGFRPSPAALPPSSSSPSQGLSLSTTGGGVPSVGGALLRGAGQIFNPLRRIPILELLRPTDELAPPTGVELPRTLGRSPSGPAAPFEDLTPRYPTPTGYPPVPEAAPTPNFVRPDAPAHGGQPIPLGMPGRAVAPPQTYPHMPWPDTGVPPITGTPAPSRRPRVTPATAGPAAVQQQPNLGNYNPFTTVDRPNASATGWNPGAPRATALDLSRLFGGGGQPPVAAPVVAPAPVRRVLPTTPLGQGGIGSDARFPLRKPKSSSSSQGGGY